VTGGAAVIRLEGVGYTYPGAPSPAVDGVTLTARAGEVVAVAGESGSGKSTLARLIAGLVPPDAGSARVDGIDTRHARRRDLAGRVALVFQHPNHQLLAATVREELALGPRNMGVDADEVARRTAAAADRFGLTDVLDDHPHRLGLPARRRLAIAAVLALRAPLVVLDEPTAGLDEAERDALAAVVREEAARGAAVIVVSHDLRFVGLVAERLLVLRGGRVAAEGPADGLLADADRLAAAGLEPPALVRLVNALGLDAALAVRGPGDALVAAARTVAQANDER
jgi:energy-coupling factor transporter ATP-binding protein EcfA2